MDKKIVDYRVLHQSASVSVQVAGQELAEEAMELIKEGWQPYGGVACMANNYSSIIMQTMVKYETTNP